MLISLQRDDCQVDTDCVGESSDIFGIRSHYGGTSWPGDEHDCGIDGIRCSGTPAEFACLPCPLLGQVDDVAGGQHASDPGRARSPAPHLAYHASGNKWHDTEADEMIPQHNPPAISTFGRDECSGIKDEVAAYTQSSSYAERRTRPVTAFWADPRAAAISASIVARSCSVTAPCSASYSARS